MRITEVRIVNTTNEELRVKAEIRYTLKEQTIIPFDNRKIRRIGEDEDMEGVLEIVIEKDE